jgi:surface-anchored protein
MATAALMASPSPETRTVCPDFRENAMSQRRLVLGVVTSVVAGASGVALASDLISNPTVFSGTAVPPSGNVVVVEDIDLSVKVDGDELEFEIHDEVADVEYEPNAGLFYVAPNAAFVRPAGAAFDFIGVPAGTEFALLPSLPNPELPYLGWSTEEIADGVLSGGIRLKLIGVAGGGDSSLPAPGVFSVFTLTDDGVEVHMTSSDGLSAADFLDLPVDVHEHFNIAFSAPGLYAIELEASANLVTGAPVTGSATYYFNVAAVPEPAALGALAPAALLLARRRR